MNHHASLETDIQKKQIFKSTLLVSGCVTELCSFRYGLKDLPPPPAQVTGQSHPHV